MQKRLYLLLTSLLIVSMLLAACGGAEEETPTPEPAPAVEQPTEEPAPEPTEAPAAEEPTEAPAEAEPAAELGSEDNPLTVVFVPSGDSQVILTGGEQLDALMAEQGLYAESSVATSYAAAIEAMCAGQADIVWLAPLSYVIAKDKCSDAQLLLTSMRFGSQFYNGQIMVNADAGIESIEDLDGKKFAFTDPASTSGYLYPTALLADNGVELAESFFAGSHNAAALAVYRGQADAGASYVDVRNSLEEDFPDIKDKTQVVALTDDIPNDTVTAGPHVPAEVAQAYKDLLIELVDTEAGAEAVYTIYQWEGVGEADDSFFDPVREAATSLGIELQNWVGVAVPYQVGQVTDVGGIDDKSFNQTAWKGVQDAMAELPVEGVFLESQQQTDYEKNLNEFLSQEKDLIITVGFLLADATQAAAEANPDANFAIIDSPSSAANIKGLLFDTSQPSFLAGYLAAGMTESGVVCTYGGINIPPVTDFMIGFQNGVDYYNAQKGADVTLLGWENATQDGAFTGNFESTDDGRRFAENFFDEGCDVILPVAGPVGLGSAAAAQERGLKVIGVDTDQYVAVPEFGDVWLTSIMKNMDAAVFDTIQALTRGNLTLGDDYLGTLANGGVGLAPFHEFEDTVPAELQSELEAITELVAAGGIDTRTGEIIEIEEPSAAEPGQVFQVGQVTDVGGIDDKSFNQTAWKGVQDAMAELPVEGVFLESQQQTDYEKNINEFLSQEKDLIITVGFLLADATQAAAEANPDAKFAIIDSPSSAANVKGLLFDVGQATYLAGYLAAGMTETGVVCTYGGINIPPVTEFMIGFQNGVDYYNAQRGADVTLLGWDNAIQDGAFTGNFESTDDGRRFAENFFDEGCDIIMPVAGPVGLGSAAAALDRGLKVIGVDADQFESAPEFGDVWLTSILKNMDAAVYDTIAALVDGSLTLGDNYLGTLENGGVGLAPYHNFEDQVPADLQAELEAVSQEIIDGNIDPKATGS
jgi:basic membrane protein A